MKVSKIIVILTLLGSSHLYQANGQDKPYIDDTVEGEGEGENEVNPKTLDENDPRYGTDMFGNSIVRDKKVRIDDAKGLAGGYVENDLDGDEGTSIPSEGSSYHAIKEDTGPGPDE